MSVSTYNWAMRSGRVGLARSMQNRWNSIRNTPYPGPSMAGTLATRARQRAARSYTQTLRRRKKTTSGLGVTTQHDSRLVYRKRSMGKGRRRRWRAFKNKVKAVSEKDLGTQQVVFNNSYTFTNNVAANQLLAYALIYPLQSGAAPGANDLSRISTFIAGAADTPGTGLAVSDTTKIMFQSGILDLTIRNASTYYDGTSIKPDGSARMEVDVYECTQLTQASEQANRFSEPLALFAENQYATDPIGGGSTTTEVALSTRGCTPFDLSYVLSQYKIKIWKKTKYQLSNGDQVTYQIRDPRRRVMNFREMTKGYGYNKPGWTKFVIIVAKLAPGLPVGPATVAGNYQENLVLGMTRKYTFKVENWSEDRSAYYVA